jgi:hypothetical protein
MEWILVGVVLAIPLLVNIPAVPYLRDGYRITACVPLLVPTRPTPSTSVSVIGRGNLAGLFTMIAAGPSLALLGVVLTARLTASLLDRWSRGRSATGDHPAAVPEGVQAVPAEDEVGAVAGRAVDGLGHVVDIALATQPERPGHVISLGGDGPDDVVVAVDSQGESASTRPAPRGLLGFHAWLQTPREAPRTSLPSSPQPARPSASEAISLVSSKYTVADPVLPSMQNEGWCSP